MRNGRSCLAAYSTWSDDELNATEPRDFANLLHQRALAVGNDLYDPDAYELFELESGCYRDRLTFYLRRRSWGEWYFGVGTPARQITLLGPREVGLKLRLSRQIVDEVRHHDVFSNLVRARRGQWRLTSFVPPHALLRMHSEQLSTHSAAELAAANQYSGEIVLSVQSRTEENVLRMLLDEPTIEAIEDIEADEPAHIAIGRDLIQKHALSPDLRRRMADAQERFLEALISQHSSEIEMLGATRVRPLPYFGELRRNGNLAVSPIGDDDV
jgi:hypothetical protein